MLTAAILGGRGYVGGELLRLLLDHPRVEVVGVSSRKHAGTRVDQAHPNLLGRTALRFVEPDALPEADVVLSALPHGVACSSPEFLAALDSSATVIDLSADFRLRDADRYERYYGPHPRPDLLDSFTVGLPELNRPALVGARRIAVPGCIATAITLSLAPLAEEALVEGAAHVDARSGSSGAGEAGGHQNAHAERSGAMRVYAPLRHRHEAEVRELTGVDVTMSATGVDTVRGVQAVCHVTLTSPLPEPELTGLYARRYKGEPFMRFARRRGAHRLPDPRILAGSNYCDIGIAPAESGARVVVVAALDNLVKGAAGGAVQALNVSQGWDEGAGLGFAGLHPV